jgi:hypothetical protein
VCVRVSTCARTWVRVHHTVRRGGIRSSSAQECRCHQLSDAVAESYVVALKLCYTAIECALPSPSCAALCILAGRSAGGPCAIVA